MIQIVRTLPTQNVFCTFSQHTFKTHISYRSANLIRIDQTRVTEYFRLLAKYLFDLGTHTFHLFAETIFISQRGKTMRIRLAQEFTTSGLIQLMQQLDHTGRMYFQLFQRHTRNRQSHLKSITVILCHFNQGTQRRNIGTFSYITDTAFIFIIIIIIMITAYIKTTIAFQMDNLMYFKIKTYCFHILIIVLLFTIVF